MKRELYLLSGLVSAVGIYYAVHNYQVYESQRLPARPTVRAVAKTAADERKAVMRLSDMIRESYAKGKDDEAIKVTAELQARTENYRMLRIGIEEEVMESFRYELKKAEIAKTKARSSSGIVLGGFVGAMGLMLGWWTHKRYSTTDKIYHKARDTASEKRNAQGPYGHELSARSPGLRAERLDDLTTK